MTRIVAGEWKGRRLRVPARGTRPTSERVREALFSRLEARGLVEGARVLDLYAGSGALGLEALSRGASSADLVDSAGVAVRCLRANAAQFGAAARVHRCEAATFVRRPGPEWDLVFADPPYACPTEEVAALLDALPARLAADACVVWERASRDGAPPAPAWAEVWEGKAYGETTVWLTRARAEGR